MVGAGGMHVFNGLADFAKPRSFTEAVGFYIFYSFVMLLFMVPIVGARRTGAQYPDATFVSAVGVLILSVVVLKAKGLLWHPGYLLIILLGAFATVFSPFVGPAAPSFLSTRRPFDPQDVKRRNLWIWWTVACAAGMTLTAGTLLVKPVLIGLCGAVIGAAQWFVLRPILRGSGWWVLACGIGWLAGYLAFSLLVLLARGNAGLVLAVCLIAFVIGGAAMGALQWLVLRNRVHQAAWWVPTQVVGMSLLAAVALVGGSATLLVTLDSSQRSAFRLDPNMGLRLSGVSPEREVAVKGIAVGVGGVIGSLTYGAVTGAVLVRMRRDRGRTESLPS
jgi:hypothetical protein